MTTHSEPKPVRAASGRVVGEVCGNVLRKSVRRSIHFLRSPAAIAWDVCALEQAAALGATRCEVMDVETQTVYSAPLSDFWTHGLRLDRGHGEQVALPLDRWQVRRPGQPEAVQLALWGEGQP